MSGPTVFIRRLSLREVFDRQVEQHDRELARHNAGVIEALDLQRVPRVYDQVLEQFPSYTRRWCR